jgi:hypothetical protein
MPQSKLQYHTHLFRSQNTELHQVDTLNTQTSDILGGLFVSTFTRICAVQQQQRD